MSKNPRLLLVFCVFSAAAFAQQPDASQEWPDAVNTASVRARDGGTAVPHFVRFNGVVKDDAGNSRTGVVGLTFALYDQNDGGAAIWQETQNVTLDEAGRYNVVLGATKLRGLPMEPFVSGEARFIGVRIVEENAMEQPRVRLVSVPYALTAGDAQSLGGRPVTDFALTKAAAAASGDTQAAPGLDSATNSGTAGFLGKFTNATDLENSVIFDTGANVGIGTTNPTDPLHVNGAIRFGAGTFVPGQAKLFTSAQHGTLLTANTGSTNDIALVSASGNLLLTNPTGTNNLVMLSGGSLGVNTSNVTERLTVNGGIKFGPSSFSAGSPMLYVDAAHGSVMTGSQGTSNDLALVSRVGNLLLTNPTNTNNLVFFSGGNFGLNTFTPTTLLDVNGVVRAAGGIKFSDNSMQTTAVPSNCTNTQIPKWNGTAWACAADAGGAGGGPAVFTGSNATQIVYATQGGSTAVAPTIVAPPPSAIRGDATAPTLATPNYAVGVLGTAVSKDGYGVLGVNAAASGDAFGIVGLSSASPDGTGIIGESDAATGLTTGVWGLSASTSGTGVFAQASALTGEGWGVWGITNSAAGYGGVFTNNANGNIIQGTNATTRVFRLDGTGKGFFNGGTQTGGADFAESVAVLGSPSEYQPGDVMVIDPKNDRQIVLSNAKYARNVAGVYSTKPGVLATQHNMDDPRIANAEIPLAIVGIVPCKVNDEGGAIARGDLLVTSSTPGYAMKGTDNKKMLGAIIGKAMQPLKSGKGTIEILITLQ